METQTENCAEDTPEQNQLEATLEKILELQNKNSRQLVQSLRENVNFQNQVRLGMQTPLLVLLDRRQTLLQLHLEVLHRQQEVLSLHPRVQHLQASLLPMRRTLNLPHRAKHRKPLQRLLRQAMPRTLP